MIRRVAILSYESPSWRGLACALASSTPLRLVTAYRVRGSTMAVTVAPDNSVVIYRSLALQIGDGMGTEAKIELPATQGLHSIRLVCIIGMFKLADNPLFLLLHFPSDCARATRHIDLE